ncbi:MAG: hypothetical protein ACLQVK_00425 [Acidimicrobiales bacterium]
MSTTVTTTDNRDPRAEALFAQWNIPVELDPEFPVATIRRLDGAQVRDLGHIAPGEGVQEYATQMRSGALFPPIVLMKPNILVDGNTRLGAATTVGRQTLPAYIIDVPTVDFARSVAGALNQLNGRRLDAAEAQRVALTMQQELKFNDDQIAAYVGRSSQMVRTWRRQAETEARARRLGLVEQLETVSKNQQDRIASISHDAPFAEVVKLLSESKVPNGELRSIVQDVMKAPSEADELERVARARAELRAIGPRPRHAQVNPVARRARMVIPQLLNLKPLALLEPARLGEDRKLWAQLRGHCDEVLRVLAEHPEPML